MDTKESKADLLSRFPITTWVVACYFVLNGLSLLILNFANRVGNSGFNDAWIFAMPIVLLIPLAHVLLILGGLISICADKHIQQTQRSLGSVKTSNGFNPLWVLMIVLFLPTAILFAQLLHPAIHAACREISFVATASPEAKANRELEKLLHYRYDRKQIEHFIDSSADINRPGKYGMTALMVAANAGDESFVQWLLARGANPSVGYKSVYGQETPLTTALEFSKDNPSVNEAKRRIALTLIRRGASLQNALSTAIRTSNDEALVKALLEAGALPQDPAALGIAARMGKNNMIELLLKHGADVNYNKNRRAPLYEALFAQKLDTVRLLIAKGADVDAGDENGTSYITMAAGWKNPAYLNALLAAKAKSVQSAAK